MPTTLLRPTGRLLLALVLLTTSARSAIIPVPAGGDLQAAIDGATAGDILVVDGGTHGPITIDKPLSIVAHENTRPLLQPPFSGSGTQPDTITLAGPGSGRVLLSHIDVGGTTNGIAWGAAGDAIAGGGFDELFLTHCAVAPPSWVNLTGTGLAPDAIAVSVPMIIVQDSTVTGGEPGTDFFFSQQEVPRGGAAIRAPSSTVSVIDSTIRGGNGMETDIMAADCGAASSFLTEGEGGTAIIAPTVYSADSRIEGGEGASVSCETGDFLLRRPHGEAFEGLVTHRELGGTLIGSGEMVAGSEWVFTWVSDVPALTLHFSFSIAAPTLTSNGVLYSVPGSGIAATIPGGHHSANLPVPDDPNLAGVTVVIQLQEPGQDLSKPLFATVLGS